MKRKNIFIFDNLVVNRVLFNYTLKGKLNCIIVFH